MNYNDFRDYLRNETNLLESSIDIYVRTIKEYNNIYNNNNNIENIKAFVNKSFKLSNSSHKKFIFKYYLKYIGKPELYKKLPKVRVPLRKRNGNYLPKEKVLEIINNIDDPFYRDIATLQYLTGARAKEIITLRKDNIYFEEDVIKIRLIGKGDKHRIVYIRKEYKYLLEKHIRSIEWLFIITTKTNKKEKEKEIYTEINKIRTYYYLRLKKSCKELGIFDFGTHDLRRNFAQEIRKETKDIFMVKKMLGHSNINTTIKYFDDNPEDIKDILLDYQK